MVSPNYEMYTPDFIVADSDTEEKCRHRLAFNATLPSEIFSSLKHNDVDALMKASSMIPFKEILQNLDAYEKDLEECTHQYTDILQSMMNAKTDLMESLEWSNGQDFQFVEEVKSLIQDISWINSDLMEAYIMENQTKYRIYESLTPDTISSILEHATQVVKHIISISSELHDSKIAPLREGYRQWYTHLINLFVQRENHFRKEQLIYEIKNLSMWLQPESNLHDVNLISFALDSSTLWRSWPTDMDLSTFAATSLQNTLDHVDFKFFAVLVEVVEKQIANELIRKLGKLETGLTQVQEFFAAYGTETQVKEQHIM